ncbi:uncharacterized protein IWZ02DRAFT_232813 [Phyllosticta citriasiana]|uniref:Uncharacterized protein n=1 Tax=Phyllosticta citriasiana TaxID=595635 RepID=A0ABR1KPK8_9PEZI
MHFYTRVAARSSILQGQDPNRRMPGDPRCLEENAHHVQARWPDTTEQPRSYRGCFLDKSRETESSTRPGPSEIRLMSGRWLLTTAAGVAGSCSGEDPGLRRVRAGYRRQLGQCRHIGANFGFSTTPASSDFPAHACAVVLNHSSSSTSADGRASGQSERPSILFPFFFFSPTGAACAELTTWFLAA